MKSTGLKRRHQQQVTQNRLIGIQILPQIEAENLPIDILTLRMRIGVVNQLTDIQIHRMRTEAVSLLTDIQTHQMPTGAVSQQIDTLTHQMLTEVASLPIDIQTHQPWTINQQTDTQIHPRIEVERPQTDIQTLQENTHPGKNQNVHSSQQELVEILANVDRQPWRNATRIGVQVKNHPPLNGAIKIRVRLVQLFQGQFRTSNKWKDFGTEQNPSK